MGHKCFRSRKKGRMKTARKLLKNTHQIASNQKKKDELLRERKKRNAERNERWRGTRSDN